MRALVAAGAAALAVAGCGGSEETVTLTVTTERTTTLARTQTVVSSVLPAPVERTRTTLLEAAESGDYERVRRLVPAGLSYSFGGPVEGGAIAYWQELERSSGQRPLAILAALLRLPPTLYQGIYVWPFAFALQEGDLTPYERGLLRDVGGENLSDDFGSEGTGYLGWRVGIEPDGDWVFFIAGD